MHAGDRAANSPRLGLQLTRSWILKLFGTVVWCRRRFAKEVVLELELDLLERHEHSNRCTSYRFLKNREIFSNNSRFLIFCKPALFAARHAPRPLERLHEHLFHHRPLSSPNLSISCGSIGLVIRKGQCRGRALTRNFSRASLGRRRGTRVTSISPSSVVSEESRGALNPRPIPIGAYAHISRKITLVPECARTRQ